MTPYNPKEHVPGTKSQTVMKNPMESVHPKVISINDLDKVEKYIKTKLSRNDLLEVKDTPYFRLVKIQPTSYKTRNSTTIDTRTTSSAN